MSDEEIADVLEVGAAPTEEAAPKVEAQPTAEPEPAKTEAEAQAQEGGETEKKGSDTDKGKESDAVQRRINKITAEKYELRRQLEEERKKREELESAKPLKKEPKLDDPDINYDQDKLVERIVAHRLQEQKQTTTKPQVDPVKAEKVAAFSQKLADFKSTAPDYEQVVSQMPIGQNASDAILEMDNGPAVAYYLAKHLDVVDELNSLTPVAAILRVQELSKKLQPASPKISTAPEPVESVKNGGGKVTKNTDDMSIEELARFDAEQFKLRHRR